VSLAGSIPAGLRDMPLDQLEELLCRTNPGVWAERKRGFENAPFHWEWYRLFVKEQRCCVVAPRDHSKSECFTVNGTAWRSSYFPGWWTYVFAATADQAAELKSRVDAALHEADPWLVDRARALSKMESVYANGSRVTVAGAGKAVRGAHPELIIGDDVLEEATALTEYQRKKTERWWFGTVGGMTHPGTTRQIRGYGRIRFAPTQTFLVGTPFHSQDLIMGMRANVLWSYYRYAAEYDVAQLVPGTHAVEVATG
jgi:hypothetical protein